MNIGTQLFGDMDLILEKEFNKPTNWPQNGREAKLDLIQEMIQDFINNPSYTSRERLLAVVCDDDANQYSSFGEMRVTEYEAHLLNWIYFKAEIIKANSIKVYLYDLITESTRLQKVMSWSNHIIGKEIGDDFRIKPYEDILVPQLMLYHLAYQKYTVEKNAEFADQLLNVVTSNLQVLKKEETVDGIAYAFLALLNDISHMRGNKKERLWEFTREDMYKLFELESKLLKMWNKNISNRPIKGMVKNQISNYILKSRNGYNEDYICKYVSKSVAEISASNHEIWINKIENLNDEREQKVIPELFEQDDWITYQWAKNMDFTSMRRYFVSSYSKSLNNCDMQNEYGECIYGYKNDRIIDLIGPIGIALYERKDNDVSGSVKKMKIPFLSQVVAFDVIYNRDEAKEELKYLFNIVDLFDLPDTEKHEFLEEILQYWILSVKDYKWHVEHERRYVIFMYEDYNYLETAIDDGLLKINTTLFLTPDFIIGDNPAKEKIRYQVENKQKALISKEYVHCKNCLMQNYDVAVYKRPNECPICGSTQIEMIYPSTQKAELMY